MMGSGFGGTRTAHHDDVAEIFAAAIKACDRSQQKDSFPPPHAGPRGRPCCSVRCGNPRVPARRRGREHSAHVDAAHAALRSADTNACNSFISVLASAGGMGEVALPPSRKCAAKVEPDAYTYAGVITACSPLAAASPECAR